MVEPFTSEIKTYGSIREVIDDFKSLPESDVLFLIRINDIHFFDNRIALIEFLRDCIENLIKNSLSGN